MVGDRWWLASCGCRVGAWWVAGGPDGCMRLPQHPQTPQPPSPLQTLFNIEQPPPPLQTLFKIECCMANFDCYVTVHGHVHVHVHANFNANFIIVMLMLR